MDHSHVSSMKRRIDEGEFLKPLCSDPDRNNSDVNYIVLKKSEESFIDVSARIRVRYDHAPEKLRIFSQNITGKYGLQKPQQTSKLI
jgi:hypothetical protein